MRVVVGLLLAVVAWAQDASAIFEGRVLSAVDGRALSGAKVTVIRADNNSFTISSQIERLVVETDAAGRFRYTLEPGVYEAYITADGFAPFGPPPLRLAARQTMEREVRLEPEPVISGRVRGPDGEPVPSPSITLYTGVFFRGERRLQATGAKVSSNERGEFRITGIRAGRYYIGSKTPDTQMTLYPNALSLATAQAVTAVNGLEVALVDIRLRREPLHTLRGKVVDASGDPVSGVLVSLQAREAVASSTRLNGTAEADGSFAIAGLPPGGYLMFTLPTVVGEGKDQRLELPMLDGRKEVYIGKDDLEDVEFRLLPRPEVTGTVLLEDGTPVRAEKPFEVFLGDMLGSPVAGGAQTEPDGSFKLQGLAASRYSFELNGVPAGHYVKSIRFGGQELVGQPIDFTSGASGRLDIIVSSKAAVVTGVVRNEKFEPQPGMWVYYWRGTGRISSLQTDQNGGFRLDSLPPGDYRFASFEEVDYGVLQNEQFRAAFAVDVERIEVKEGEQKSVELETISRAEAEREAAKYP